MTGQSESLPMTTATWGAAAPAPWPAGVASLLAAFTGSVLSRREVARRAHRTRPHLRHVIAERGHVADLAPRPDRLAVQVHLHPRVSRHHVRIPAVHVPAGAAE